MKITYVPQRRKADCVIACLAMILEINYERVESNFFQDFDKAGIEIEKAIFYLGNCGLSVVRKKAYGFDNLTNANREMWKPFAQVHLIKVRQWADLKTTHAIVMGANGKIYDPVDKNKNKKDYYEVLEVVGCFLPKLIKR